MDFSLYSKFNEDFNKKFESFSAKYPSLFFIIEKELRNSFAGRDWLVEKNLKKEGELNWRKFALSVFIWITFPFVRKSNNISIGLMLNKFESLREGIIRNPNTSRYNVVNDDKSIKNYLNGQSLLFRYANFSAPLLCMYFKLWKHKPVEKLVNYNLMNWLLNKLIENDINRFSTYLSKTNIKLMIVEGQSSVQLSYVTAACQKSDIKVCLISHGYIQDPFLISIAPVRADKLYVWTNNQKKDLISAIPSKDANKVECKGFPYLEKLDHIQLTDEPPIVGMVLDPLPESKEQIDVFAQEINSYINLLHKEGLGILIRPHPKNSKSELLAKLSALDFFTISESEDIYDYLSQVSAILITNSSVGIQSIRFGVDAYQISELRKFEFEDVPPVTIDNAIDRIRYSIDNKLNINRRDFQSFEFESLFTLLDDDKMTESH